MYLQENCPCCGDPNPVSYWAIVSPFVRDFVRPNPDNVAALRLYLEVASIELVEIHQSGVGADPGVARFETGNAAGNAISKSGSITIPIETVDQLLDGRKPDL